jgi:integrase
LTFFAQRSVESIVLALACTGLRISELAGLRWSDVDLRSQTLLINDERFSRRKKRLGNVRTTKGRRDRRLPIHPDLLASLQTIPHHADGRIFHGPRGGIVKPDTVRIIFVREVIEALKTNFPTTAGDVGFEHGRIHSFRHYFCSQAFLSGAAAEDIQEWLGHQDSKMVAHYRHLRADDSQRKIKQIDFLGRDDRSERRSG